MRYKGQSYELNVPYKPNFIEIFENSHHIMYGYSNPNFSVEIVNLRVRAHASTPKPDLKSESHLNTSPSHAFIGNRSIIFTDGGIETPIYRGEKLKYGNHLTGPALIVRSDTTILLNPGDECLIDEFLNMIIKSNMIMNKNRGNYQYV
jgi:N-methylhydantoinase A